MKRGYLLFCFLLLSISPAYSMHIMEGFLSLHWCLIWALVSLPFFIYSCFYVVRSLRSEGKNKLRVAFASAFIFILSALRLPSVAGSSSHMCGTTLGVILLGPWIMPFIGFIVLLFHALLLGHGGLSTLGANLFSMFIVGPWLSWFVYKLLYGVREDKYWKYFIVFVSTFIGVMSIYLVTSFQLALNHHGEGSLLSQTKAFFYIYSISQVPLALLESVFTVYILNVLNRNGIQTLKR